MGTVRRPACQTSEEVSGLTARSPRGNRGVPASTRVNERTRPEHARDGAASGARLKGAHRELMRDELTVASREAA